jgi:hypothetical protein
MADEQDLPRCVVCRTARTEGAYELGDAELAGLAARGVRSAGWLHRKYGALPICRPCFEDLGFQLESEEPGSEQVVRITRRR